MTKPHVIARLLYLLARVIGMLPFALLQSIGKCTGFISYLLNNRETQVARSNMQLIYPNESEPSREKKVKAIMRSTGQTVFERLNLGVNGRYEIVIRLNAGAKNGGKKFKPLAPVA